MNKITVQLLDGSWAECAFGGMVERGPAGKSRMIVIHENKAVAVELWHNGWKVLDEPLRLVA